MTDPPNKSTDIRPSFGDIEQQCGEVFIIDVVPLDLTGELEAEADAGKKVAQRTVKAVDDFLELVEDPPEGTKPPGCILCRTQLGSQRRPRVLAFVHALTDEAHHVMAYAVCECCADELGHDLERLRTAVVQYVPGTLGDFCTAPAPWQDSLRSCWSLPSQADHCHAFPLNQRQSPGISRIPPAYRHVTHMSPKPAQNTLNPTAAAR